MRDKLGAKLVERFNKVKGARCNYEDIWQLQADYVLPNNQDFTTTRSKGTNQNRKIYDTSAVHANQLLAATLHGGLTNASTDWFDLGLEDQSLRSDPALRYLSSAKQAINHVFNSTNSNFQSQVHEFYLSLCAFGTACMFVEETDEGRIQFSTIHLSEIYIQEDKYGNVDTVFRKYRMTARQISQLWGDDVSDEVKKAMEDDMDKMFDILHVVMPKTDLDDSKLDRFAFSSVYVEVENEHILEKGGFHEMPYIVARFDKLAGEIYGRGPAWNAMADIRMINAMAKTIIRAAQMQSAPPLLLADDGVMMPIQAKPNGMIIGGLSMDGSQRVAPLNIGGNLGISDALIQQRQKMIRDAFFVDELLFREGTPVTATESLQRQDEKLRLLSPHIGRVQSEFLSPLITRVLGLVFRSKKIQMDPPPELSGQDVEIVYKSPLIRLQKSNDIQALGRFFQSIFPLLQITPEAIDILNLDAVVMNIADASGLNIDVLRSQEEVSQMRQQRAEQQQQMMAMEQMKTAADVGEKFLKE